MMKRRKMLNDKCQGVFMIVELSFSECNWSVQPREERTNIVCCSTVKDN